MTKKQAKILRCIQKGEAIKKLFEKLKTLRQKRIKSGVTSIEVPAGDCTDPKACTEWKQIDIPSEVLQHLLMRNRTHFGQAAGNPFTRIPPLSEDLLFAGNSDSADAILRGDYIYRGDNPNVGLLVRHLRQTQEAAALEITSSITEEEFVGKLKAWRESTATSPSGLH
jgi:hypothetical protein